MKNRKKKPKIMEGTQIKNKFKINIKINKKISKLKQIVKSQIGMKQIIVLNEIYYHF